MQKRPGKMEPVNIRVPKQKIREIDMGKSAGPSTVVLVTVEAGSMEMLKKSVKKPVQVIGRIS